MFGPVEYEEIEYKEVEYKEADEYVEVLHETVKYDFEG